MYVPFDFRLDAWTDFHCGNSETAINYILRDNDDSEVRRESLVLSRLSCATAEPIVNGK